jgi:hypothetical protein
MLLLVLIPIGYHCIVVKEISALFEGKSSGLFYHLVQLFYPRFFVEMHRFDLAFFLSHAQQVIWRFEIVSIVLLLGIYAKHKSTKFNQQLQQYWHEKPLDFNSKINHFIVYGAILYYFHDYLEGYAFWIQYADLYQAILLFKILHISLLSLGVVQVLFGIFCLATIAAMFRIQLKISSLVVCLLFILFQGWNYSFGKINHGFALLTYASILLCIESYLPDNQKGITQRLIQLTIAFCYLMAGLEKLFISHFDWVSATTFQGYLLLHPTPLSEYVLKFEWLCVLLPSIALAIQLGFVGIIFFKKLRPWILTSGVCFHFGTVVLLGISSYVHPWVICYIFFVDWNKLFKY